MLIGTGVGKDWDETEGLPFDEGEGLAFDEAVGLGFDIVEMLGFNEDEALSFDETEVLSSNEVEDLAFEGIFILGCGRDSDSGLDEAFRLVVLGFTPSSDGDGVASTGSAEEP